MGNSFGCSASGERLVSAARDGDLVEAKMLLDCNPFLAKYSTFGGLNSPLHFAAAKGHNEIVALLLENGADVNSRNYCGQTALMQACRHGHWEVVQTLLLFRCNVTRTDYLSGRTALHLAAANGHARCIRLVVADFVPSAPYEAMNAQLEGAASATKSRFDRGALSKFVNKAADGGITALHMAALNGYFDCVQLLLDIHANVSAVTFHYGTTMDLIGAGSNPLHYAACGGNLKCCQILLARGASRRTLNCNGWLPLDVARMWGRHWLEPLLAPNSDSSLPRFPHSNYLALPLLSVLDIARESGMQSSTISSDERDICAVCLERACNVTAEGCGHVLHVHSIFARQATFIQRWCAQLAPSHVLCAGMQLLLLLSCPIPWKRKRRFLCPLVVSVPLACFSLVIQMFILQLVRQRSDRIVWRQFLLSFYAQSPVAHFHLLAYLCVLAMTVHAHRWNHKWWKAKTNYLVIVCGQHLETRIKWKGQHWRKQAVLACFGGEEAAAESIDAIQK